MPSVTFARDGRDNNFHLIRHLAAAAVVLTHSYSIVTGRYASEPLVGWFGTSIGHYAVDVFFVLSGFLIAQSLAANPDLIRFAVSRLLRVFPALMIAVALVSLVIGPLVSALGGEQYFADPDLARYIVGTLSTLNTANPLPGVFEHLPDASVVNAPLWTLKYELAAYASIAALSLVALAVGRRAQLFAAVALALVYLAGSSEAGPLGTTSPFGNAMHLFVPFYLGVMAYLLRRHIPLNLAGVVILAGLAVVARPTFAAELTEKAFIAYAILWIAFLPGLRLKALERFGDCSYGIYIYAFPIQQTLRLVYPQIEPLALFTGSLALTLPLAYASWHLVERPCLEARNSITAAIRGNGPQQPAPQRRRT